jgi:MoaA/NifB/PqqE/SkfB family radical SAM enzyme
MMTEEQFQRIIIGLHNWGFKGRISLHGYNEPLLDQRLCRFIKFAKIYLPHSRIVIFSNGDLLTEEKMQRLIAAGMEEIIVSVHEPTSDVKKFELVQLAHKYPAITLRDYRDKHRNSGLMTRGKEELVKKMGKMKKCSLCYIIYICIVRSDGNVVLCCQDSMEEYVMGNIATKSIREIWESSKFKKIRNQVSWGKFTLPICKQCGYQTDI